MCHRCSFELPAPLLSHLVGLKLMESLAVQESCDCVESVDANYEAMAEIMVHSIKKASSL